MKNINNFNEYKSEGILVRDRKNLKGLINKSPLESDLNHLDVSRVTNMKDMFSNSQFSGDISKWN